MEKGLHVREAYSCVGGKAGEGTAQLPGDSLWGAAAALPSVLQLILCSARHWNKETTAFCFVLCRIMESLEELMVQVSFLGLASQGSVFDSACKRCFKLVETFWRCERVVLRQ